MKRVLIISPHFPPVNSPDMQRVRTSLSYYQEFGWIPEVICVDARFVAGQKDEWLNKTIPDNINVHRTKAFPLHFTRMLGVGSLSLRSFIQIRRMGNKLLRSGQFDLVFFSTTMFHVMANGPYWKRRFGVPYVLDFQDPWRNDFYLDKPKSERPPKFRLAYWLNARLESFTVPHSKGLVSVSDAYLQMLEKRYPALSKRAKTVIPFGVAPTDFDLVNRANIEPSTIVKQTGRINVVYAGAVTPFFIPLLHAFFSAFKDQVPDPDAYHFYFIGTSYAPGAAEKRIEALAQRMGLQSIVTESPDRVPYFTTLATLQQADILLVPGSTDPDYNASKILNYIFSRRPIFCMFHEKSETLRLVKESKAGTVVGLSEKDDFDSMKAKMVSKMSEFTTLHQYVPHIDTSLLEKHTARALTEQQARFFDGVLSAH